MNSTLNWNHFGLSFAAKKSRSRLTCDLKETELAALGDQVMTAMASRQVALDKRRLEAVDQIWSAVTALAPAKSISMFMSILKYDNAVKEAARNAKFRETFALMGSGFDIKKYESGNSSKARPFVSPMAWALFSAYQAILLYSVSKLNILKIGIDNQNILDIDYISKLVKAALPQYEAYIDKFGDGAYHYLLDELETRLFDKVRMMLAGKEADKESIERAAEILRISNEFRDSTNQNVLAIDSSPLIP